MSKYEEHTALVRKRCLSDIETGEDGYKCWWPLHGCGSLNAIDLRIIADYLDELNKDWDEEVRNYECVRLLVQRYGGVSH